MREPDLLAHDLATAAFVANKPAAACEHMHPDVCVRLPAAHESRCQLTLRLF